MKTEVVLKPICSYMGCRGRVVAQVFFANGGGTGRYCVAHMKVKRATSNLSPIDSWNRISKEVRL